MVCFLVSNIWKKNPQRFSKRRLLKWISPKNSKLPTITKSCNIYAVWKLLFNTNFLYSSHRKKCESFWTNLCSISLNQQLGGVISFEASQVCHTTLFGSIYMRKKLTKNLFFSINMGNMVIIPLSCHKSWQPCQKTWPPCRRQLSMITTLFPTYKKLVELPQIFYKTFRSRNLKRELFLFFCKYFVKFRSFILTSI